MKKTIADPSVSSTRSRTSSPPSTPNSRPPNSRRTSSSTAKSSSSSHLNARLLPLLSFNASRRPTRSSSPPHLPLLRRPKDPRRPQRTSYPTLPSSASVRTREPSSAREHALLTLCASSLTLHLTLADLTPSQPFSECTESGPPPRTVVTASPHSFSTEWPLASSMATRLRRRGGARMWPSRSRRAWASCWRGGGPGLMGLGCLLSSLGDVLSAQSVVRACLSAVDPRRRQGFGEEACGCERA